MKKGFRLLLTTFLFLLIGYIIYLNTALGYQPRFETIAGKDTLNE